MNREKLRWGSVALAMGLAGGPVFAQPGVDFFRLGKQHYQVYSSLAVKPHPLDESQPLEARARAYLDANCSYCHQPGAVRNGGMDLRYSTPLERTALLAPSGRPGPGGSRLMHVRPGNAQASEIYLRLASLGRDGMPPLGKTQVDEKGLALIRDWIESLSEESLPPMHPSPEKKSPYIHYYRHERLEIGRTGLGAVGIPVVRIFDGMGRRMTEISVSAPDNPIRNGWTLGFSRPLPRGRYWMVIGWDAGRSIRDLLVL